jgi:hypothetical protein
VDDDLRLWPLYTSLSGDMLFRPAFPIQGQPHYVSLDQIATWRVSKQSFDPKDYGADITGVADATAAIQAAQAAALAAGGGEIRIEGMRLKVNSSLTVVAGCPIIGTYIPHSRSTVDYSTAKSALILAPTATINLGAGAYLQNILLISSTLPPLPATVQAGATMVAGFSTAGTAVTAAGTGATLQDVQILGFALGISAQNYHQLSLDRVFLDCYAGVDLRHAHDMVTFRAVEIWPFLTASQTWTTQTVAITGAADNGNGKPRITADTTNLVTGNTVFITGVGGFTGVNTKCTVGVVDATHFDCTNLVTAPAATGSVTNGSQYIKLSAPDPSISNGQTVTGTGIPGSTTVSWVSNVTGWMRISQKATATNAAVALTFANGAYTSGGTAYLSNDYRAGTGFYFEDNVLLNCVGCFSYGHQIGFDLNGERNDNFIACASDYSSTAQDPTSVGVYMRGVSRSNSWLGGYIHGQGIPLICNSSDPSPNTFMMPWINQSPAPTPTIELLQGEINITNTYIFNGHSFFAPVFVADAVTFARFSNCDMTGARGDWTWAGSQKVSAHGSPFSSQGYTPEKASAIPLTGTSQTTIAANVTTFAIHGQSTNVAVARESVPSAGVMRNLYVENTVAPGGTETQIVTVQRGGTDTPLTVTLTGAARTANTLGTGLEQAFIRGDTWVVKIVTSAAAATTTIKFGVEWVPSQ